MKIALFSRERVQHTAQYIDQIFAAIERHNLEFIINEEFAQVVERLTDRHIATSKIYDKVEDDQSTQTIMLCLGGDGTILYGLQRLCSEQTPIVGVNSGRVGFLTTTSKEQIDELFEAIIDQKLTFEPRTMLSIECNAFEVDAPQCAANELALMRDGASMLTIEVKVNSQHVATYHGDGIIIATPTGSTAYSLSAGGAILAPSCECFTITPLAAHNLTMRPVVVPDSSIIELSVSSRSDSFRTSIDNHTLPIDGEAHFTVKRSPRRFLLGQMCDKSFYDTLREKMMWGVDLRS